MKKESRITLRELAKKSGLSKSSLGRALNNCPGVNYEIWRAAKDAADKFGYTVKNTEKASVGILLPYVPEYFWGSAFSVLKNALDEYKTDRQCRIYPYGSTPEDICSHIDDMVKRGLRVLIMPVYYEEVIEHLDKLSDRVTLFQICEYGVLNNSFVFASDGYADGTMIAEYILQKKPDSRVLLLAANRILSQRRKSGFCSHFPVQHIIGEIAPFSIPANKRATVYASFMSEICDGPVPDYVICCSGTLSHVSNAIIKCGWQNKACCVGFEKFPALNQFIKKGLVAATIEQNITAQCEAAANAAIHYLKNRHYPQNKYNYIPSSIHIFQ